MAVITNWEVVHNTTYMDAKDLWLHSCNMLYLQLKKIIINNLYQIQSYSVHYEHGLLKENKEK